MCLQLGSKDNMTAMVIRMEAQQCGNGGGVQDRRKSRESESKAEDTVSSPNQ